MSKIGRRPIALGSVTVDIKGNAIHYKSKTSSDVYHLPHELQAEVVDNKITLKPATQEKKFASRFKSCLGYASCIACKYH